MNFFASLPFINTVIKTATIFYLFMQKAESIQANRGTLRHKLFMSVYAESLHEHEQHEQHEQFTQNVLICRVPGILQQEEKRKGRSCMPQRLP